MAYTMVHAVMDLIDVFTMDSLGNVIVEVCVMGACVALWRYFEVGAGG